jgi:CBS domain-containing protein
MKAKDIMTPDPACCTPDTPLREVAQTFIDHDCGAVPVVDDSKTRRPLGIVTDRDVACRAVAAGKNALEMAAREILSTPCVTVPLDASLDDVSRAMETNRVRRLLVVDSAGACVGIIAQADLALRGKEKKVGEVVKEISKPTGSASAVSH